MSTTVTIIPLTDSSWDDLVGLVSHDIYHTREYNTIADLGASHSSDPTTSAVIEGFTSPQPFLFNYRKNGMVFFFPYVLRTLEDILGYEGRAYYDVTSVYGFGGPLASANASPDFLRDAWGALISTWKELRVISAFTRFHPLLQNVSYLEHCLREPAIADGLRGILCGHTVSIDLSIPEADQFRKYAKNLRNFTRRAYASGFEVHPVDFESSAALFVRLYTATMNRRNASGQYLIDRNWLLRFRHALGDHCSLLAATFQGDIAAMLLVMEYRGFVHAHLTGIDDRYLNQSPLKPLLDSTRIWASKRGNRVFHLGGGFGARHDSLFRFKHQFSPDLNQFHIACWILAPRLYRELSGASDQTTMEEFGLAYDEPKPFPAYRFMARSPLAEV